jgi:hypothetical protein
MKNDALTTVLNWILAVSLVLSAVYCLQFFFRTRELRSLQSQKARYDATHAGLNLLVNETIEYSKRNPDINPLLEAIGAKSKTAPAAAIKPASK